MVVGAVAVDDLPSVYGRYNGTMDLTLYRCLVPYSTFSRVGGARTGLYRLVTRHTCTYSYITG